MVVGHCRHVRFGIFGASFVKLIGSSSFCHAQARVLNAGSCWWTSITRRAMVAIKAFLGHRIEPKASGFSVKSGGSETSSLLNTRQIPMILDRPCILHRQVDRYQTSEGDVLLEVWDTKVTGAELTRRILGISRLDHIAHTTVLKANEAIILYCTRE